LSAAPSARVSSSPDFAHSGFRDSNGAGPGPEYCLFG
jgi:hypothetical protein